MPKVPAGKEILHWSILSPGFGFGRGEEIVLGPRSGRTGFGVTSPPQKKAAAFQNFLGYAPGCSAKLLAC